MSSILRPGVLQRFQNGLVEPVAHAAVNALSRELGDAATEDEYPAFLVEHLHILTSLKSFRRTCKNASESCPGAFAPVKDALVPRSINTLAFERRYIRACCVPLPRRTHRVHLGRAPCRSGASALSIRHRIYGTGHLVYQNKRRRKGRENRLQLVSVCGPQARACGRQAEERDLARAL